MSRKRPSFMVHDLLKETEVTLKHWQHEEIFNFPTKKKVLLDDNNDDGDDDDDDDDDDDGNGIGKNITENLLNQKSSDTLMNILFDEEAGSDDNMMTSTSKSDVDMILELSAKKLDNLNILSSGTVSPLIFILSLFISVHIHTF